MTYDYAYAYHYDRSESKVTEKNGDCAPNSPPNCFATPIDAKGYSAGQVLRITNGIRVSRADQKNSCPPFYKIWSPRNKEDWISVYNALERDYYNYPRKPFLIVDVTRPWNGCGGCSSHAMKSTTEQQGSWRTTDGSPWWLRDSKFKQPNGDYSAHCFMHIQNVHPDNVQFNDAQCNHYSSDYLCQPVATQCTYLVELGFGLLSIATICSDM